MTATRTNRGPPAVILLVAALVCLAAGVLAVSTLQRRPAATSLVDGFVLASLAGLLGVHLIPESLAVAGWPAAVAVVAGVLLPRLLEGRSHHHGDGHTEPWSVVAIAAGGLGIHAFLDGGALAMSEVDPGHGEVLALGVVLHRLPMGILLGLLGKSRGPRVAWAAVAWVAAATVAGFAVGVEALPAVGHQGLAVLEALVAGTLMHVVLSQHGGQAGRAHPTSGAVGAVIGVALTVLVLWDHPPEHDTMGTFSSAFIALACTAAPGVALGMLLARWRRRLGTGRQLTAVSATIAFLLLGPATGAIAVLAGLAVERLGALRPRTDLLPIDRALPSVAFGLVLASTVWSMLPRELDVDPVGAAVVAGLVAVVRPIPPATAALVSALILSAVDAPGAAVVFAVLGPAPSSLDSHDPHKRRALLWALGAAVPAGIAAQSLPSQARFLVTQEPIVGWVALAVITALAVDSLRRRGPRGWVDALVEPHHAHAHDAPAHQAEAAPAATS